MSPLLKNNSLYWDAIAQTCLQLDPDLSQWSAQHLGVKKMVVGLSGGVDSAVTALILKALGHDILGVFMKNWEDKDDDGVCQSQKDYEDVMRVCQHLAIDHYTLDLVEQYRTHVFDHFLEGYRKGITPNPDLLCNKEIKFQFFYEYAKKWGADFLATGHYCQIKDHKGTKILAKGADPQKDQSYFLAAINAKVLRDVCFPLGGLLKKDVRDLARRCAIPNARKKDSTGVCFIGERNFKNFLSNYIQSTKGEFQTLDGTVVGRHDGMCYYTLGQRKGLGLGGAGAPWFVVDKDTQKNIVFVERGDDHPHLYRKQCQVTDFQWLLTTESLKEVMSEHSTDNNVFQGKVRYRGADQKCRIQSFTISQCHNNQLPKDFIVEFDHWQRAMAIGQYVVLYIGDICLGAGAISRLGECQSP